MSEKKQPDQPTIPAHQLLSNFIKENKIVIDFVKPNVRFIEGGSLLIDRPQMVISYAKPTDRS